MISERISADIPPQIKILNMVIPILMHFCSFVSNWSVASPIKLHKASSHQTKCDVINDIKLFPTVYHRIYCLKFFMLSNQTSHNKSKCSKFRFSHVQGLMNYSFNDNKFTHLCQISNFRAVGWYLLVLFKF